VASRFADKRLSQPVVVCLKEAAFGGDIRTVWVDNATWHDAGRLPFGMRINYVDKNRLHFDF
jgi:hypothetical protein